MLSIWETLTLVFGALLVCSVFVNGCLWWEMSYWREAAESEQKDTHKLQRELSEAKQEADQWERRCCERERVA